MNVLRVLGVVPALVVLAAAAYAAFGLVLVSFDRASYDGNATASYDYDAVLGSAREAGYDVERVDSSGFHPDGVGRLDAALGSDYEFVGASYPHGDLELHVSAFGDERRTELAVYRIGYGPVAPADLPEPWLTDRVGLLFGVDDATAAGSVAEMRTAAEDGPPQTYVERLPDVAAMHAELTPHGSPVTRTWGDGQGGVVHTYTDGGETVGELRFVVGRAQLTDREGRWTYVVRVDRADTVGVTVTGPAGGERTEAELRETLRERFVELGIPARAVDDIEFSYRGSVW